MAPLKRRPSRASVTQNTGSKVAVYLSGTLADAYRRMRRQASVQKAIDEVLDGLEDETPIVPADLSKRIRARQKCDRTLTWDGVLQEIAKDDHEDAG